MHIDEWLEIPSRLYDNEAYAKFILTYFRYSAWMIHAFHPWMKQFKLFCTYNNERYRVTGASRLGDIWLTKNPDQDVGYSLRVFVDECSNWTDDLNDPDKKMFIRN
jgi:hypothetical protein